MVKNTDHRGAMLELGTGSERRNASGSISSISVKDFLTNLPDDRPAVVLALDGITDVNNLGAIMRSADQFSVDLVMVPERRSAQANETVLRISSGAATLCSDCWCDESGEGTRIASETQLLGLWCRYEGRFLTFHEVSPKNRIGDGLRR